MLILYRYTNKLYYIWSNFLDWVLHYREGVCHCGELMDNHTGYEGHSGVEMYCLRKPWRWLSSEVTLTIGHKLCLEIPLR